MVSLLLGIRVVMVVAGLVLLGGAAWVNRHRESPALQPFVVLVAVLGTLAVVDGLAAGDLTSLSLVWMVAFLAIPCSFTWFVVEYYGLPYLASTPRKAAFLSPAVAGVVGGAALILSPTASGSMAGGGPTAPAVPSLLGFAALAEQVGIYYAGGIMLVGVALLARTVADYEYLDGRLGATLSFIAVWPWVAYFVTPGIVGRIPLDVVIGFTASGYVLSAVSVGVAVTRGGLFDAAPAAGTLGPETVLAELDDAVVVVDREQRVVQLNEAAVETFGVDPATATGEPLSACLSADIDTLRGPEAVELRVPDGTRQFEASVSPVRDRYDRQPGYAIVLTDVTRERVRSQRLAVLNRVLRHNLRNEMTSIMGRAQMIADGEHEYADPAERILSSADDLMTLGDRARQIDQFMAGNSVTEVVLADLVEDVLDDYRAEYPDASLSMDIPGSLVVSVDRRTLFHVLDNLVENALVHNDAPTPVVTVSARASDERVRLSVSDNGPGLPEQERTVIEAGDETPLEHGSGLGLWTVKWGAIRLGGELDFSANEPRGTVVSVHLAAASDPDATLQAVAEAD